MVNYQRNRLRFPTSKIKLVLGIISLDLNASIMSADRTKIILNCPKLLDLLHWQMLEIKIKKNIFMHLILIQTKVFQKSLMT